ncbi:carbon-nitrogen hydrolase family protein [Exiguobacterium sp. s162]|uniref:carbon-nitrogen hydrolase family protein n=1 Tax=Exiguobacterium sp. s162 TaxID=2751276 RepID=UPI001BEBF317|nr:carbon-nitrogen hydrolase family protein [Exiguobacterium sp. s162]
MKIGLAQTKFPRSKFEALQIVGSMVRQASQIDCEIICFPESIIPGLRGVGYHVDAYDHTFQKDAIDVVCRLAELHNINIILPIEWKEESGLYLVALVISTDGKIIGSQTKNQFDPEEDQFEYTPGQKRHIFEVNGVKFGIVICHEGWRYPETVRWAAMNHARIVFHPQFTGEVSNPDFFNHAMVCRSLENNIYFASVNYALDHQKSTSSLISPQGERLMTVKPGAEELLVYDINPALADLSLANRFDPNRF